jgi:phospholipid/cholesterol/gamma-HCH transport system permease protein
MQAFFSATFRDGSGAVVGLGMLRNLGALVSGWTLAAVAPALLITELRGPREGLDLGDPFSVPDRAVRRGEKVDERVSVERARLAASRIVACALAAVVLGLWGAVIGIGMGMSVADSLLGVIPGVYAGKLVEMVTPFDLFSLAVKSVCFGGLAGLAACYEGLREEEAGLSGSMFRAACVSMLGIMILNGSFFTLAYLSGEPGGPVVQQWIR